MHGRPIALTGDDHERLAERFAGARTLRFRARPDAAPPPREGAEVVLIMGLPAAGKSTVAARFVAEGYIRLNRDEAGGTLRALLPALDRVIAAGATRIVLDNTYVSRKRRAAVVQAAALRGLPVRCIWLSTGLDDAQVNAAWRIVTRHGRLLAPQDRAATGARDVSVFGPTVQFRFQRELEPPDSSEGFSSIEVTPFVRQRDDTFVNRAVIVWCDGVLLRSRSGRPSPVSGADVEIVPGRADVLRRYAADGWRVLGVSWRPEVSTEERTAADVDAEFARMREILGIPIEVEYCPHGAGAPACWCRKPLPGLGVLFIQRYRLDPSRCIYVGSGAQDPVFARRLGFQYRAAADFFC